MATVSKKELCKNLVQNTDISLAHMENMLNNVLDGVSYELTQGNRIEFRDFGIFEVRERKERKGRNPKTGEAITIPASKVVVFKPGKALKERLK